MSTWAIVPVKSLFESKSRLATVLSTVKRAALARRLLTQTLQQLNNVPALKGVLVISRDTAVWQLAAAHGATVIPEPHQGGLNEAVTLAAAQARTRLASRLLILPIDLPFLTAQDLNQILPVVPTPDHSQYQNIVVIGTDQQRQGTNLLLLSAHTPFTFHFGRASFQRHLQEAAQRGLMVHSFYKPSLAFDLDTAADWNYYQQRRRALETL